jgi:hypothetical protein
VFCFVFFSFGGNFCNLARSKKGDTEGGGGGWERCKWFFFGEKWAPKEPHHEEKKNVKPPYLDNRFQNYVIHSPLGKANSKSLDFLLLPLAKFI